MLKEFIIPMLSMGVDFITIPLGFIKEIALVIIMISEQIIASNAVKVHAIVYYRQLDELFNMEYPLLQEKECLSESADEEEAVFTEISKNPEVSALDEGAEALLDTLETEFMNQSTDDKIIYVDAEDCLTIDDWIPKEVERKRNSFTYDTEKSMVVSVIGMEENFLHVNCSGNRKWMKLASHINDSINLDEILLIQFDDSNTITYLLTLETEVTDDYNIPDEIHEAI